MLCISTARKAIEIVRCNIYSYQAKITTLPRTQPCMLYGLTPLHGTDG